jgi:translation initiation factor 2 alpha subunit (eIF-2alpha)
MQKLHLCPQGWQLYDEYGRVMDNFERAQKHTAKMVADLRTALNNYNSHKANCNECKKEER